MDVFVVIDRDHGPEKAELRAFATHNLAYEFLISIPVQRRTTLYRITIETEDTLCLKPSLTSS